MMEAEEEETPVLNDDDVAADDADNDEGWPDDGAASPGKRESTRSQRRSRNTLWKIKSNTQSNKW